MNEKFLPSFSNPFPPPFGRNNLNRVSSIKTERGLGQVIKANWMDEERKVMKYF